jgi:hypothetical protein
MIQRFWRRDLFSLRHSGSRLMTFLASYFLVLRMTKANAKRLGRFRCSGKTARLMTRATRRDIAAA